MIDRVDGDRQSSYIDDLHFVGESVFELIEDRFFVPREDPFFAVVFASDGEEIRDNDNPVLRERGESR